MSSVWGDLDGDRIVDSQLIDVDGDGHIDVQFTDTNHDGVADVALIDHNRDGVADVQVFSDQAGGGLVMEDHNADGVADRIYEVGPFDVGAAGPSSSSYDSYPATDTVAAGPFPVGGDTAAVLNNVNSQMADAGLIYRDAMNPGSVDQDQVEGAMERSHNAARNAETMAGYTYQQKISNDIHQGDLDRAYQEQSSQAATDTYIEADRANSRADWAVWNSQQERGV
ncbi:hypothetical protein KZZ52_17550 [Dactylosporangium sp. AC04546]|uniref:hypothetical protein n=1 Tax=Dactylosporangium sp. AC04546 TaxID=2862460 RepID=UPI001EDE88DD|nr:hypothetical protein [Dactylosporangium sp. AC04546]WVK87104.1 hypothetical protein KZZ52_17550 [Dactylosporangium sp. AC04546]